MNDTTNTPDDPTPPDCPDPTQVVDGIFADVIEVLSFQPEMVEVLQVVQGRIDAALAGSMTGGSEHAALPSSQGVREQVPGVQGKPQAGRTPERPAATARPSGGRTAPHGQRISQRK